MLTPLVCLPVKGGSRFWQLAEARQRQTSSSRGGGGRRRNAGTSVDGELHERRASEDGRIRFI